MVEEQKIIRGNNMMVGTPTGFDPYNINSSTNPNDHFFNFEQHNSVSHNSDLFWKPSSSSKPIMMTGAIAGATTGDFFQFDESSLQRPSQGLSLSLSSTIGIQPFELIRQPQHHQGYFGKQMNFMHEQHDMIMTDDHAQHQSAHEYNIRSSRYLVPAQDLLNEFCNLGSNHSKKAKAQRTIQNDNNINDTSSKNKPLDSLEFLELQKRKSKLLHMLEEVDRKYHNYCDQMKAVVSSFEAVSGNGAATVYSALASKAMSRHFRRLRDEIVGQIKETKKAMGEKDISALGATRGETPRLRLLDQTLREQRAFQQMTLMDNHPWRPQRGLPERSVSVLRAWLFEHFLHPYPSDVDKHILARQTGLSRSQVSNWFINARVRLWKPMVEEMYVEETKDNDYENINQCHVSDAAIDENTTIPQTMEQKPTVDQLIIRRDSDCLSSIINHQSFARVSADPFGAVELDFSAYNNSFGGSSGGGGVSLTLGLQQHAADGGGGGGGGVSLYYPRDHLDDCQTTVQYSSLLEGDQGQNLQFDGGTTTS